MIRLRDGIELVGKSKDTGYNKNSYLIKTADNQFIELTGLLYNVVAALKKHTAEERIAHAVSQSYGKVVDVQAIRFLVDTRLKPLGILVNQDKTNVQTNSLLALKFRFTLIPERLTEKIAMFFSPLFAWPIIIFVLIDFILLNIWLFGFHGVFGSLQQSYEQPFTFLLIIGLLLLSTLFHEFGHAAGCAFGGAKPGRIGAGLYFIWPAFFTDISDIYRLDRKAKLRSDIGGIYFNCIFALIITAAYFITGFEPLLLVIVLQNFAIFNQTLPFIRLDGYYILSDIVGLPDLFLRIKPVLKNIFFRQKDPALKDVKPWVKWTIVAWICTTIPLMGGLLVLLLINSPRIFYLGWMSGAKQLSQIMQSTSEGNYIISAIEVLQMIVLLLPVLGIGLLFYFIGKQIFALNERLKYY
jgi:putative peptide zinc metalloprotease protein